MFTRFMEATTIKPLEWTPAHKIVKTSTFCDHIKFGTGPASMIIVPPEAGHSPHSVDFAPGKSLVQTALKTHDAVIVPAYKSVSVFNPDKTPAHLVAEITDCLAFCGKKPCITGFCQGGWQAAMTAALHPDKFGELFLINAPIDLTPTPGSIADKLKGSPQSHFKAFTAMCGGIQPGWAQLSSWKMMHPEDRFWNDFVDILEVAFNNRSDLNNLRAAADRKGLLKVLTDQEADKMIAAIQHFRSWYETTYDMGGSLFCWIVKNIFRENALFHGQLEVNGRLVDLHNIKRPISVLWSIEDDITMKCEAEGIENCTNVEIRKYYNTGGHLGGGISRQSQKIYGMALENIRI